MTPPCAKMVSFTMSTVGFFDSSRAIRPPANSSGARMSFEPVALLCCLFAIWHHVSAGY